MKGFDVLALQKVVYENGETVITAENMNEIQEEIIANREAIDALKSQSGMVSASVE